MSTSTHPHAAYSESPDTPPVADAAQRRPETVIADGSTNEPSADSEATASIEADYDPEREVQADIDAITGAYRAWDMADVECSAADARSNEACYRAIGEIFVRAAPTDEDSEKRRVLVERLIDKVNDENWRYDPTKHSSAELHLTLQFGVKHRKGAKSNWKTVLTAAEMMLANDTIKERSIDAFVDWLKPVGIKGARDIVKGSPAERAEAQIAAAEQEAGVPFELPIDPEPNADVGHKLAVMLVNLGDEESDEGTPAQALGLLRDAALVKAAWAALVRQKERRNKQQSADAEDALDRTDTPAMSRALLIPKSLRHLFEGRAHFTDEDERDEFYREGKAEQKRTRARLRRSNPPKSQLELAKKGRGKARLTRFLPGEAPRDSSNETPASSAETGADEAPDAIEQPSEAIGEATDAEPAGGPRTEAGDAALEDAHADEVEAEDDEDGIDYFAKLRVSD